MIIRVRKSHDIPESRVTPRDLYMERRRFLTAGVSAFAGLYLGGCDVNGSDSTAGSSASARPASANNGPLTAADLTPREHVTSYNNFIELGSGKDAPARNAGQLVTRPWTLRVDGECEAPGDIGIEDILAHFDQEERIYRLRCVEAWAMVIPWKGFPLGGLLQRFRPTSSARYVAFETLDDPAMLPGQRRRGIYDWPYTEGLRMDEAMHPLTILATGLYGDDLPNQNGAPLRLVVPWKYGFKSIKSIVRISFTERQPPTLWNQLQGDEYGFFANVNPEVDHPRWSQRQHRVIGAGLFEPREETLMLNGYADEVAHLYDGMDLHRFF